MAGAADEGPSGHVYRSHVWLWDPECSPIRRALRMGFSWFCERVLRQGALDECVAVRRDCVGPTSGSGSAAVLYPSPQEGVFALRHQLDDRRVNRLLPHHRNDGRGRRGPLKTLHFTVPAHTLAAKERWKPVAGGCRRCILERMLPSGLGRRALAAWLTPKCRP